MPSRLSSLLVRDGLVGVKRMEKAFQRQVIYGGSLDTILLEMALIPEDRLTQYLALASGLPPASRAEGGVIASTALELVDKEIAEQYRAIPLAVEGEALRILVCAPLELSELEDLADLLDRPLQPLITPEFRWHLVFASAYGLEPPARFTTLARSIDVDPITTPVGRARSVIVDSGAATAVPVASDATVRTPSPFDMRGVTPVVEPVTPETTTMKVSGDAPTQRDLPSRHSRPTIIGVKPARAATEAGTGPARTPGPASSTERGLSGQPWQAPHRVERPAPKPAVRPVKRAPTAPITTAGRDSPIPVVRARELLATAEDRDTVFLTLLRAARARARYAGLLTVQGGAAIGRVALAEPTIDIAAIHSVLIPLDAMSAFRAVVSNHQPHIGPIASGDPAIDSMVLRFGGTMPPSALIMPIVLRDRVVALVLAHRVYSDLKLVDVTELLPLATAASDAIGRLIVRHKAAGYRAPVESPVVDIDTDFVDTKRMLAQQPDPHWSTPDEHEPPSVPYEEGTEVSITAEPPRAIDDVLGEIENAPEGAAEDAMADAVDRALESVSALMRRFPGRLRVDRFNVTGRPLRAAQYGGLLELVIRLGPVAAELLIEKMNAPQRDVRFYATVCTAELRPRTAVYALVERVFDQDYGVRATAIEALAGYPLGELGHALVRARRALHSSDPEVVLAATSALFELGDIEAVPDLISIVESGDRNGENARKALTALTAQDFGASEKKWRKWWDAAQRKHRIEWLIEGLNHREDAIREGAINDLRRLTGEYFGYHHDLPKRDRELAAERWANWWRDSGHHRFVVREDERHRPTALLPIRRD
jgi:hypothetical protein